MESTSEETPTQSHRSWWKLHWLTWVVLFCVVESLVVENLVRKKVHGKFPHPYKGIEEFFYDWHGWPVFYMVENLVTFGEKRTYYWPLLFTNIIIALVIFASTAFTTETYLRRQEKWHQFSIQFILALTAFVALILANAKYDLVRWRGDAAWEYIPFLFIWFGCWCVFWTACRLIGLGVSRIGGDREKDEDQPDSDTPLTLHT